MHVDEWFFLDDPPTVLNSSGWLLMLEERGQGSLESRVWYIPLEPAFELESEIRH
jgi:hypothetical protein